MAISIVDDTKLSDDQRIVRDTVRQAAMNRGVDPDYAELVAFKESRFNPSPKMVSPRGAKGIMGLTPDAVKQVGYDPDEFDYFNIDQNIDAGVLYMKWLADQLDNDGVGTLAAYNWGIGNYRNSLTDRTIKLPDETRDYLNSAKTAGLFTPGRSPAFGGQQVGQTTAPAEPVDDDTDVIEGMPGPLGGMVRQVVNPGGDMTQPPTVGGMAERAFEVAGPAMSGTADLAKNPSGLAGAMGALGGGIKDYIVDPLVDDALALPQAAFQGIVSPGLQRLFGHPEVDQDPFSLPSLGAAARTTSLFMGPASRATNVAINVGTALVSQTEGLARARTARQGLDFDNLSFFERLRRTYQEFNTENLDQLMATGALAGVGGLLVPRKGKVANTAETAYEASKATGLPRLGRRTNANVESFSNAARDAAIKTFRGSANPKHIKEGYEAITQNFGQLPIDTQAIDQLLAPMEARLTDVQRKAVGTLFEPIDQRLVAQRKIDTLTSKLDSYEQKYIDVYNTKYSRWVQNGMTGQPPKPPDFEIMPTHRAMVNDLRAAQDMQAQMPEATVGTLMERMRRMRAGIVDKMDGFDPDTHSQMVNLTNTLRGSDGVVARELNKVHPGLGDEWAKLNADWYDMTRRSTLTNQITRAYEGGSLGAKKMLTWLSGDAAKQQMGDMLKPTQDYFRSLARLERTPDAEKAGRWLYSIGFAGPGILTGVGLAAAGGDPVTNIAGGLIAGGAVDAGIAAMRLAKQNIEDARGFARYWAKYPGKAKHFQPYLRKYVQEGILDPALDMKDPFVRRTLTFIARSATLHAADAASAGMGADMTPDAPVRVAPEAPPPLLEPPPGVGQPVPAPQA